MSDIVVVLGAGASAACGGPVMGNFLDKARDILASGRAGEAEQHFKDAFKAIGGLQAVHSKADLDIYNVESVFTAFEMAEMIRPDFVAKLKIQHSPVGALLVMISGTLELTILFPVEDSALKAPAPYQNLAMTLKRLLHYSVPRRSASVLTFNYDLGLDFAFRRADLWAEYSLGQRQPLRNDAIRLLKLHGSLNWFLSAETVTEVHLGSARMNVDNVYATAPIPFEQKRWYVAPTSRGQQDVAYPFLVPPTLSKTQHYARIAPVWEQAATELSEAEYIFVCGYSLPDTDQFFKYLFALGAMGQRPLTEFLVVDPDIMRLADRYKALLGKGSERRFSTIADTFQSFPRHIETKFSYEAPRPER